MTADGPDGDAASTELAELDEVDEPADRAVIVSAVPQAQLVAVASALGRPGRVVADPHGPEAFFVGALGDAVAVAVACSAARSTPPAVILWLHDPGSAAADAPAGVIVVHRSRVLTDHQWPVEDASLLGDAALLAEGVGRPELEVGLRALLRRNDRPAGELLAELVELAGLPPQAVTLLTSPVPPLGAEVLVARRRGTIATARALSRALPPPGWFAVMRRWWWLFPAVLSLCFAVRAALAAAVGTGDPGDEVGYAVLAVIAACGAVFWRWRGRRDRLRD